MNVEYCYWNATKAVHYRNNIHTTVAWQLLQLIALKKQYILNMHEPMSSEHLLMQIKYS